MEKVLDMFLWTAKIIHKRTCQVWSALVIKSNVDSRVEGRCELAIPLAGHVNQTKGLLEAITKFLTEEFCTIVSHIFVYL